MMYGGVIESRTAQSDAATLTCLRRAEEGALGSMLVELRIVLSAARNNGTQVLRDTAAAYKVDTDAIALKVKHELPRRRRRRPRRSSSQNQQSKPSRKLRNRTYLERACLYGGPPLSCRPSTP
jgi:ParB family chromosome partitioning protein